MATLKEIQAQELAQRQAAYQQASRGQASPNFGLSVQGDFDVRPTAEKLALARQIQADPSLLPGQRTFALDDPNQVGLATGDAFGANTRGVDLAAGLDAQLQSTQDEITRAIAAQRGELQEDFDFDQKVGERNFERQRRNAQEDFADRIAIQNANIGREKKGLANANYAYREFMDRINPGFAEAVEAAERGAKATAAIEATFDEAQGEIDAAYSSAGGRVRAIADVVGAGGNGEVAAALHETVYEMKGFIDAQNGLNRTQTLAMHDVAANLAAAAAQQGLAQAEGEGTRDIYQTQGQYEKIINNLVQQRDLLNNQKQRALRNIDEAQADWNEGRDRDFDKRMEQYDVDVTAFQANADWKSYGGAAMGMFFEELNQDEGTAVPKTDRGFLQDHIAGAQAQGFVSWDAYMSWLDEEYLKSSTEDGPGLLAEIERLTPYEEQFEIGVNFLDAVEDNYNEIHAGNPTSEAATAQASIEQLRQWNLPEDVIRKITQERLRLSFPG